MTSAQRWTWALLATLIGLSIVFIVALEAEASDCYGRNKCNTTTTTGAVTSTTEAPSTTTTTLPEEPSTTTTAPPQTTTSLLSDSTTTTPASTTTVLIESTTSQPSVSTDPTVAPADIELPDTGLSHDVWAGLTFAGFVLLTMGGMAVLAGRDDE